MGFKEETFALNRISVQAVGGWLGIKLPLRGTVRCPFHDHHDQTPSFHVEASGNRWICYGCNRRGGSIDLIRFYNDVKFIEAKRWLAARANVPGLRLTTNKRDPLETTATSLPPLETQRECAPDFDIYEAFLQLTPLAHSGLKYLQDRCLSNETISEFRIGQVIDSEAILRELMRRFGTERVAGSGLLAERWGIESQKLLFPEGSIVFPFYEGSRPAYLQARTISNVRHHPKWWNLKQRKRRVYNLNALAENGMNSFAICEGIMDTLTAVDLGYSAVGLMGVSARLTGEHLKQLRGKHVSLLLDWDEAGERRAEELQLELHRLGIPSTRKSRPLREVKDLNEYYVKIKRRK